MANKSKSDETEAIETTVVVDAVSTIENEESLVMARADIAELGAVGSSGYDNSDIRIPYIQMAYAVGGLADDFNQGEIVFDKQHLILPKGCTTQLIALSASDKYWVQSKTENTSDAPEKFVSLDAAKAEGFTDQYTEDMTKKVQPAEDLQVLIAEQEDGTCAGCTVSVGGKNWVRGILSLTKMNYKSAGKAFNSYYRGNYEGKGYAPYQLVWNFGTKPVVFKNGNKTNVMTLGVAEVHKADSELVEEIKQLLS